MERNTFWQFIDEARQDVDDIFEIAPALSERLLTLEPDEIISFGQHMADARAEAYR